MASGVDAELVPGVVPWPAVGSALELSPGVCVGVAVAVAVGVTLGVTDGVTLGVAVGLSVSAARIRTLALTVSAVVLRRVLPGAS